MHNIVSEEVIQIVVNNLAEEPMESHDDILNKLENIRNNNVEEENNEKKEYSLKTTEFNYIENFIKTTYSVEELLLRFPIENSPRIISQIEELENNPLFIFNDACILYVPQDVEINEDFYFVESSSKRFNSFLANFGNLINIKNSPMNIYVGRFDRTGNDGLYGIHWQNKFTQLFAYVNTLSKSPNRESIKAEMRENQLKRIKKYLEKTNVLIIWDEYNRESVKTLFTMRDDKIYIILNPLEDDFWSVKLYKVLLFYIIVCNKVCQFNKKNCIT